MVEFLFLITTYNRFDNLKSLIDSIIPLNGTKKIIIVDDCSTDERYENLIDYHDDVLYYKTETNNGKINYWKTVNLLYSKVKNIDFKYVITIPDDVELIKDFDLIVRKYGVNDEIVRCFTQTSASETNWGYKYWLDCSFITKKEIFEKLEFKIDPIYVKDDYKVSSGVGKQLTERINRLNIKVVSYGSVVNHLGNDNSKMHPTLRKEEPLYGVKFNGDLVICGIATIKERKENLKLTVDSLINQVDKLIIYQNGYYDNTDFLNNEKIEVLSSLITGIDMGDAGKFFKVGEYKEYFYYLSVDDDLIYPPDYVNNLISNLKKYDNKVIVSHHGRIMKENPKSYYKDFEVGFRCLDEVTDEIEIDFGGTGVMGFHTSTVKNLTFDMFKSPNMADIWVGKYAKENNIPIIILKHNEGWLKTSLNKSETNTIFRKYLNDHTIQNQIIQSIEYVKKNKSQKVIFVTCTYNRPEVTKKIIEVWEKVQKNTEKYFTYENIVVDSDSSNLEVFNSNNNFSYYNYDNFPISNKWNYAASKLKEKDFDYVIFMGSDDFIDEDLLMNYYEKMKLNYDFIGIQDMYVHDSKTNKLYYWSGYKKHTGREGETIGMGRCFSKRIIEKLNYEPWLNGINKSLDRSLQKKLVNFNDLKVSTINLKRDGGFACDVKSNVNITNIKEYNDLEEVKNHKFKNLFKLENKEEPDKTEERRITIYDTVKIKTVKPELTKKEINYDKINSIFTNNNPKVISKPQPVQSDQKLKLNSETFSKIQRTKKRLR